MQWIQQHAALAKSLIMPYNGDMPLQYYLKKYFSEHRKHGSRDRKFITHLCYSYFRLGHSCLQLSFEERLAIALFLTSSHIEPFENLLPESFVNHQHLTREGKIALVKHVFPSFSLEQIFPFSTHLSKGIETVSLAKSILEQPKTFIRVRPTKEKIVLKKLQEAQIPFEQIDKYSIALAPATALRNVIYLNREVVVQDLNSQRVGKLLRHMSSSQQLSIWDCCAGSGGKSILVYDLLKKPLITVSDVRTSILHNLRLRMKEANIPIHQYFHMDVTQPIPFKETFDAIICDVPCSGSGTWSRTPEQLYFFQEEKILHYSQLQRKIVDNTLRALKENGYFLYITCSIFREENENMCVHIQEKHPNMQLIEASIFNGEKQQSDSMFAALFQKKQKNIW